MLMCGDDEARDNLSQEPSFFYPEPRRLVGRIPERRLTSALEYWDNYITAQGPEGGKPNKEDQVQEKGSSDLAGGAVATRQHRVSEASRGSAASIGDDDESASGLSSTYDGSN